MHVSMKKQVTCKLDIPNQTLPVAEHKKTTHA